MPAFGLFLLMGCQWVAGIDERTFERSAAGGSTNAEPSGGSTASSRADTTPEGGSAVGQGGRSLSSPSSNSGDVPSRGGDGQATKSTGGSTARSSLSEPTTNGGSSVSRATVGGTSQGGTPDTTTQVGAASGNAGDSGCGRSAVEICTDGIDNDCNGLVDCADAACRGQGYLCAPVPSGWVGPAIVWEGKPGSGPAGCPGGSDAAPAAYSGLAAVAGSCECHCGTAGSQSCTTAAITLYSNVICNFPCAQAKVSSGTCGAIQDGGKCGATFSVSAQIATPTGGSCAASVQPAFPQATWDSELRVCALSGASFGTEGGCNNAAERCLRPEYPALFRPTLCVYHSGAVASCPTDYPSGPEIYYEDVSDTRSCNGCTCGPPVGGTCSGKVTIYPGTVCNNTPATFSIGPACQEVTLATGTATTAIGEFAVDVPGTCNVATNATITGSVQATRPISVCCSS